MTPDGPTTHFKAYTVSLFDDLIFLVFTPKVHQFFISKSIIALTACENYVNFIDLKIRGEINTG